MKILREESGQMLLLTVLSTCVLFGFLAFATDVGLLFRAKRNIQIAADAAATAGALDYLYQVKSSSTCSSATTVAEVATCDAQAAATANGFTNGTNGVVVTINTPPQFGYHQSSGYVEAIIQVPNPTIFMNLLGFNFSQGVNSVNVSARAVAGSPQAGNNCMWLMDTSGYDLQLQGSPTINAVGCDIYVNSTNSESVYVVGGGTKDVNADAINTVGGASGNISPAVVNTDVSPESSPFSAQALTGPDPATDCTMTEPNASYSTTINGTTASGGTGVVCFTNSGGTDISGATLENGVFVFENGVTLGNGTGDTTITNGTIDVYGGTFTQGSATNLVITAPTSGIYNGIALLVPASNASYNSEGCASNKSGNGNKGSALQVQFGSSYGTYAPEGFTGYIIAPDAEVYLQDNGGGVTASGLYAACLYNKSSTINIPSYNAANPTTTPVRVVSLVE